jgi:hypothetical protein
MERIAYGILLVLAGLWLIVLLAGLVAAFPIGLLGFLGLLAIGLLFAKVIRERLASKDDDYYAKHVDK